MNALCPSQLPSLHAEILSDLSGRERKVAGILQPADKAEVRKMILWARREKLRLQPVSCGKNWGFGSRLPEEDNVCLLDLSRLDTIRRVDWDCDWVELEPGVTQGALDDLLAKQGRSHYFNVTGAGRQTSIIGNSLERGIGYFGSREDDILDLEVVLEDGSVFWTSSVCPNPFHTGLGPDLRSLFFQSNFGVVTAGRFKLRKRPRCMGVVLATLKLNQTIATLVDRVAELRRENLFCSVPHIGNRQRLLSTFGPVGSDNALNLSSKIPEWTCVIPISGSKSIVQTVSDELAQRFGDVSECQLISPDLTSIDKRYANLIDLASGIPNDFALSGVANAALSGLTESTLSSDLDAGRAGLIHVTPTSSANGMDVNRLLALIDKIRIDFNFTEIPMTLNLVNSGLITLVISIPFDRHNSSSQVKARLLANHLVSACGDEDFVPYRIGVEDAALLPPLGGGHSVLLYQLHRLLCSERVFAKSKYDPLWDGCTQDSLMHSLESRVENETKMEVCS